MDFKWCDMSTLLHRSLDFVFHANTPSGLTITFFDPTGLSAGLKEESSGAIAAETRRRESGSMTLGLVFAPDRVLGLKVVRECSATN